MDINIIQKNYHATDKFLDLLEKKLERIKKYAENTTISIKIKLSKFKIDNYTLEAQVFLRNHTIRSSVTSKNMWDNIDLIIPKLEKQLIKIYSKQSKNFGVKHAFMESLSEFPLEDNKENSEKHASNNKIVRVKKFDISIITPEEAIQEMLQLDHDFYVFINAENNKVSVLYKRLDENYGLITPEY